MFQELEDRKTGRVVWKDVKSTAPQIMYSNMRQVRLSCELEVGRYLIEPYSCEPEREWSFFCCSSAADSGSLFEGQCSEYLLRVFSERDAKLTEL